MSTVNGDDAVNGNDAVMVISSRETTEVLDPSGYQLNRHETWASNRYEQLKINHKEEIEYVLKYYDSLARLHDVINQLKFPDNRRCEAMNEFHNFIVN
jgi:hypothetical protein